MSLGTDDVLEEVRKRKSWKKDLHCYQNFVGRLVLGVSV